MIGTGSHRSAGTFTKRNQAKREQLCGGDAQHRSDAGDRKPRLTAAASINAIIGSAIGSDVGGAGN